MKTIKWLGNLFIVVGALLLFLVIFDIPSGYWSTGTAQITWYKVDGVEFVDEKIQFTYGELGQDDPTSEELTELALQLDPSFFTDIPINQMIPLDYTEKGIQLANYLAMNGRADLVSILRFKAIPDPDRSLPGFLVAIVCVVIGMLFVILPRKKEKEKSAPQVN